MLLARIYEVLPLLCPACGGPMRILSFLTDPPRRHGDSSTPGAPTRTSAHLARARPGAPREAWSEISSSTRPRPSIPLRPSPSQTSSSTSRRRTSSTPEGPPPAVCPDKLSDSATSIRPSEHPPVPLHHPSPAHVSRGDGYQPDSPDPRSASHPIPRPTTPPASIGRLNRLSIPLLADLLPQ